MGKIINVLESKIERHLRDEVKRLGGKCYKWASPGKRGVADRIVFLNGQIWFIELKRFGEDRTKLQIKFAKDIAPHTDNYIVIDNIKDIDRLIIKIMI
jgi:hypothetical protein